MIAASIDELFKWVTDNHYRGWDIYDGLNSPILKKIKSPYLKVFVLQGNKYCPINLRTFLKVEKGIDLKGMALFAQAYASLYSTTGDEKYLNEMQMAVDFIQGKSMKGSYGYDCWASHYYPYTSIDKSTLSLATPDIIGTCQAIIALLRSYEITSNEHEMEVATSAIHYLVNELFVDDDEMPFFKYTVTKDNNEHITLNASAQAIEAIAFFLKFYNHNKLRLTCEKASRTLLRTQGADGGWPYSIYRNGQTKRVQSDFHHGYIIDGLLAYQKYSDEQECISSCIKKASEYYTRVLFLKDGRSHFRYPLPFPIDIHNQAQGIISFSKLSCLDAEYIEFAKVIARWTIENMQDRSGYFYYQKWPIITNKIPHMRWGQAWMMLALATFLEKNNGMMS